MKQRIIWFFMVISSYDCYSQEKDVQAITVGDQIPTGIRTKVFNYSSMDLNLSSLKGKYILLDFWGTSCASCARLFPKLEAWQKKYSNKLQVLLVNSSNMTFDTEARVSEYYKKWKTRTGKPLLLPTIVTDKYLARLFPFKMVPHYVWINSDGIVQAITGGEEVTEENISEFLNGNLQELSLKMDIDRGRPLFSGEYLPISKMETYSVLFKGYISGLGSGFKSRVRSDTLHGMAISNSSLQTIYSEIARNIIPQYTGKEIFYEVSDSSEIFWVKSGMKREELGKDFSYTVDVIVEPNQRQNLYPYMLDLMNRFTSYQGSLEKRKLPCLVIKKVSSEDKLATKGGKSSKKSKDGRREIVNVDFQEITKLLNRIKGISQVFIDESGYNKKVDMSLSVTNDVSIIRKEFLTYGLDLVLEEKEVEVFVVRDKRKGF